MIADDCWSVLSNHQSLPLLISTWTRPSQGPSPLPLTLTQDHKHHTHKHPLVSPLRPHPLRVDTLQQTPTRSTLRDQVCLELAVLLVRDMGRECLEWGMEVSQKHTHILVHLHPLRAEERQAKWTYQSCMSNVSHVCTSLLYRL